MPPGFVVDMSEKSAYITLFHWLRTHFLPRKSIGTVALILDGHSSHYNSTEMLKFAQSEGILLICLPSHTTHYLQPLDRTVFKSIKHNFFYAASKWLKNHPGRKLTHLQFGELLHETWSKSTSKSMEQYQQTLFRDLKLPEFVLSTLMQYLTMHLLLTLMLHQQMILQRNQCSHYLQFL